MKKARKIRSVKVYPQIITGSIVIAGKSIPISTATVSSTHGATPSELIATLKKAAQAGTFSEPLLSSDLHD